jgi:hypothetical protein
MEIIKGVTVKDLREQGRCPFCAKAILDSEFTDDLSRKEFQISGLCQECQDNTFGRAENN